MIKSLTIVYSEVESDFSSLNPQAREWWAELSVDGKVGKISKEDSWSQITRDVNLIKVREVIE